MTLAGLLLLLLSVSQALQRPLHSRSDPLEIERRQAPHLVIGSDESGSGCIAGPIVAASCCIVAPLSTYQPIVGVDDSKRLDESDRERIYREIIGQPNVYRWTIESRSATEIDASTALTATLEAFEDSIEKLACKLPSTDLYSIVDGHKSPRVSIPSRPMPQADAIVYTVALASVLARVTRDRLMTNADSDYPEYGFVQHAGYPTREHILALHQHGRSPLHRVTCHPVKGRPMLSRLQFMSLLAIGSVSVFSLQPESSSAMTTDPRTGIALPNVGEIQAAVPDDWSIVDNPLKGDTRSMFARLDSGNDLDFYRDPRFVEHVDAAAVKRLTAYVANVAVTASTQSVLDLCSSWTSHLQRPVHRVAGLGMNAEELEANPSLTEWTIQDLNVQPRLLYHDDEFDVVLCQLSIDYLTRPLEVCREMARVLRVGGRVHILFSNRLFLTKAVALWTGADDIDHTFTVASYLHYCGGGFQAIAAEDLSVRKNQRIVGDPLYVVTAVKA